MQDKTLYAKVFHRFEPNQKSDACQSCTLSEAHHFSEDDFPGPYDPTKPLFSRQVLAKLQAEQTVDTLQSQLDAAWNASGASAARGFEGMVLADVVEQLKEERDEYRKRAEKAEAELKRRSAALSDLLASF